MIKGKLRYNERSWAIDLISFLNANVNEDGVIKRVSGELSLATQSNFLFPDVILFGDSSAGNVLQGWELKMPDTGIFDDELIQNASIKAQTLGLNSFLVWNVQSAYLYIYNIISNTYEKHDEPLFEDNRIKNRLDVGKNKHIWQKGALEIINQLNRFFNGGKIKGITPNLLFSDEGIVSQILSYHSAVLKHIEKTIVKNSLIDAKIKTWWRYVKNQYPGYVSPLSPLAYCILLRWFNRFIFSNILKAYHGSVLEATLFSKEITIQKALQVFADVSKKIDFWNVLGPADFDDLLPDEVWNAFISLNSFLHEIEFDRLNKSILQSIIKSAILSTIKKYAGLYITPENVARLLVLITLDDKSENAIDPFCGTGTIVKAILEAKSDFKIPGKDAVQQTWGSDKFAFPVQIATLSVATPETMNEPLRIFTQDAFLLETNKEIIFINPSSGEDIKLNFPKFYAIISNLPFVQFEDIDELNNLVNDKINMFYQKYNIEPAEHLDGRSDLYAYIPFLLYEQIKINGRFGIIISNSWLATNWGVKFRNLLKKFYHIEKIITSQKGRWFDKSDVVTNLLVCKKQTNNHVESITSFISTKVPIKECDINDISTDILTSTIKSELISINQVSQETFTKLEDLSIGINIAFSDFEWLFNFIEKFSLLTDYATIARGERRGWDPLFFPSEEYTKTIENEYLKPVLKTSKGKFTYEVEADSLAFCCSDNINKLSYYGKVGALNWIKRFEKIKNSKGKPLPEVLKRANLDWYQMDTNTLAEFVLSMNPDRRIFIQKLPKPTFVNQRLIRITLNESEDKNLMHAIFNSTFTMYLIHNFRLFINSLNIIENQYLRY